MADFVLKGGISKTDYKTSPANIGVAGNLEYVKMLRNPALTVKITAPNPNRIPNKGVITAALASDFGFSLGNKWTSLVPMSSLPLVGDIGQGVAGVATALVGATQLSIESLWMTSASWTGSKVPIFPVKLAFLKYSANVDLIQTMLDIAEGTLSPDISYDPNQAGDAAELVAGVQGVVSDVTTGFVNLVSSTGAGISNFVSGESDSPEQWLAKHKIVQNVGNALKHSSQWAVGAPCNYGLQVNEDVDGSAFKPKPYTTFALRIGNWFEANQLLIDDVSISFSKETSPDGTPLILYMDVTFRPYRNITFKEFSKYFVTVKSSGNKNSVSKIGGLA